MHWMIGPNQSTTDNGDPLYRTVHYSLMLNPTDQLTTGVYGSAEKKTLSIFDCLI